MPRTLLEQLVRCSRLTIEESCAAFERTARNHGEDATLSPRQLARWMAGQVLRARPVAHRVAFQHWGHSFDALIGPPEPGPARSAVADPVQPELEQPHREREVVGLVPSDLMERRRQTVHETVSTTTTAAAGLDDWEQAVLHHGRATRYRPPGDLVVDLYTDFGDLQRDLAGRQSCSALRRLTRVTAQMAGLMFLTLIKLNEPTAARRWARTARVAANEAGDPSVTAWVLAQEAYVYYYTGLLTEALDAAHHAQALAGLTQCPAGPLAAALEARALAVLGDRNQVQMALHRAEVAVQALDADGLVPSAFGYNEAQLQFHAGNAYTHLQDTRAAWAAHERALGLYPHSDYLDRTLVQLDRASCLLQDGDATAAADHTMRTLVDLTTQQRSGMIVSQARRVYKSMTPKHRALPAVCDLHELLAQTATDERIQLRANPDGSHSR